MTVQAGILSLGTLIQQVLGDCGTLWHTMGASGQGHHSGETGRSRRRWNPLPLVLFVILQRFAGGEIEAPLLAEGIVLGGQLPIDEILRLLLVHRAEKVPLHPGQRDTVGHRLPNHGRGPQLGYLRQRHRITHSGTHCVTVLFPVLTSGYSDGIQPTIYFLSSRSKSNWNLVTVCRPRGVRVYQTHTR